MKKSKICTSNQRIKELLSSLSITQTEFCNRTGINKSALSNYLNGDRTPRQDQLSKIADAFNVSPTWLMGYDVPQQPDLTDLLHEVVAPDGRVYLVPNKDSTNKEIADAYRKLIEAAKGCSEDEIKLVTQTLETFKRSREKEQKDGIS